MTTRTRNGTRLSRPARWALGYGALALLAVVAWGLVGDAWWLQPLNLTTFWWSLPAVPLVVVALLRRRWPVLLGLAPPAVLWLWSYATLFLPAAAPAVPGTLRVATFNTYVATEGIDHILGLVDRDRPDVLLLEEVFPPRQEHLAEALGDAYPSQVGVQSPGVGGVMVLSRFPVVTTHPVVAAADNSRATEVVVLDVDGRRVQVVPVHLVSPCPSCGPGLTERLELEGAVRQAEMAAVLRALEPGVPTIIGGDFNSTERSGPYRQLTRAGFQDPQRQAGSGPGFTWPDDGSVPAFLRVDWVLTRELVSVDAWVGDGGGSDHRPVVVDLAMQ